MKVEQKSSNVNPFGGLHLVHQHLNQKHIGLVIDHHLGSRQGYYQYSDIIYTILSNYLSGGTNLEDLQNHLKPYYDQFKGFNPCSADTALRGMQELQQDNTWYISDQGISHKFNTADHLNALNLKLLSKTGVLADNSSLTLDYDNTIIPCEKYDASKTYKHCRGYQPGIASIGRHIVYIEGRNGNSQARYRQKETLTRTFEALDREGIRPAYSRMDSASYQKEVIEVLQYYHQVFYIRANRCQDLYQKVRQMQGWQTIRLGTEFCQVNSIEGYYPFNNINQSYRLIITRKPRHDSQNDLFFGDHYVYRAILTNDYHTAPAGIVRFYNERGGSERNFDELNNDFGWHHLPFSFLEENTVFMIVSAICKNLFHYLMSQYSKCLNWLRPRQRIKRFIFRFITVVGRWVYTARQWVLQLHTCKDYKIKELEKMFSG